MYSAAIVRDRERSARRRRRRGPCHARAQGRDGAGRWTMLTVFDALPGDSAFVRRYRRELSAAIN
jgi:hypothetical protein